MNLYGSNLNFWVQLNPKHNYPNKHWVSKKLSKYNIHPIAGNSVVFYMKKNKFSLYFFFFL